MRIDYGKLRHLLTVNRQLNGNFDLLRHLIGTGWVDSEITSGFPLEQLNQRENFLSLLHYFGLLSIREVREGTPRLGIPNQTVQRLMYGYLRDGYRDVGLFSVDLYAFRGLVHEMAYRGSWRPVLEFLAAAIRRQTGIRDYIAGEKVIQGFLAAYLGATDHFVFHTERELGGRYADICLEPFLVRFTDMRHGYVIELKYLKRSVSATEERVAAAARDAQAQLLRYLADERLGAPIPIGALYRSDGRVPRLGTGAQRRDNPTADLKSDVAHIPAPSLPRAQFPPAGSDPADRPVVHPPQLREHGARLPLQAGHLPRHAPNRQLLIAASPCSPCVTGYHWHTMP